MTVTYEVIWSSQGIPILVSPEDVSLLAGHRWYACKAGRTFYANATVYLADGSKAKVAMHRLVMNAPDDKVVDHRDGNGLNNTRSNLRLCNNVQNSYNRTRPVGAIDYHGVSKTNDGRFMAAVTIKGVHHTIGRFDSEQEAALAVDSANKYYKGEFAGLNFPEEDTPPRSVRELRRVYKYHIPKQSSSRGGASIYSGVAGRERGNGYRSQITVGHKGSEVQYFLGNYRSEKDAALAYDSAAKYFASTESIRTLALNFPDIKSEPQAPETILRNSRIVNRERSLRTSRFFGVTRYYGGKWQIHATWAGRRTCTNAGVFSEEEEAARIWDAIMLGDGAPRTRLNFPEEHTVPLDHHIARSLFLRWNRKPTLPLYQNY